MDLALWFAFAAASAALLAMPGPVVLLAVTEAAERGFAAILPLAAGVMLGDALAMTLSLIGAGALLTASAEAFAALRLAGGAYLLWLGARALFGRGETGRRGSKGDATFRGAFLVTALHPGGFVFFVSFVPLFLSADAPLAPQLAVMTVTFVALAGLNVAAWALLAGAARERLRRPAIARTVRRIGGGLLGAAGLAAVLSAFRTAPR